jgi:VIT1/CCC1 family predicted Fe2+/Mn2+ transporter
MKGADMNIVLWVTQIVLAVKFASVAYTHGLRPDPAKMQRGRERLGAAARPLQLGVALGALLGAAGLVLPAATGTWAWLTPWAAALLALMMLGALGLHRVCRERPNPLPGLILFALAAFVAVGRWLLAPL